MITAINDLHQLKINRMYSHYRKYHELINQIDMLTGKAGLAELERRSKTAFEKYENLREELPIREITNFDKQHLKIHGYK